MPPLKRPHRLYVTFNMFRFACSWLPQGAGKAEAGTHLYSRQRQQSMRSSHVGGLCGFTGLKMKKNTLAFDYSSVYTLLGVAYAQFASVSYLLRKLCKNSHYWRFQTAFCGQRSAKSLKTLSPVIILYYYIILLLSQKIRGALEKVEQSRGGFLTLK